MVLISKGDIMRNKLVLVVMILFIAATGTALFAQDWQNYSPSFQDGDFAVQAGLGLIPTFAYYGDITIPPISVAVDYGKTIADLPLSFGGFLGYTSSKYYSYYELSYLIIGARAAYHVDFEVKNLDAYAGVMLGYNVIMEKVLDSTYHGSYGSGALAFSGYVGARYFFTDNLAAYGELGYGISVISLGVTYKF